MTNFAATRGRLHKSPAARWTVVVNSCDAVAESHSHLSDGPLDFRARAQHRFRVTSSYVVLRRPTSKPDVEKSTEGYEQGPRTDVLT